MVACHHHQYHRAAEDDRPPALGPQVAASALFLPQGRFEPETPPAGPMTITAIITGHLQGRESQASPRDEAKDLSVVPSRPSPGAPAARTRGVCHVVTARLSAPGSGPPRWSPTACKASQRDRRREGQCRGQERFDPLPTAYQPKINARQAFAAFARSVDPRSLGTKGKPTILLASYTNFITGKHATFVTGTMDTGSEAR